VWLRRPCRAASAHPAPACQRGCSRSLFAGAGRPCCHRLPHRTDTRQRALTTGANRAQLAKGAHARGSAVTCLTFSRGGFTLLSRCEDETLKVQRRHARAAALCACACAAAPRRALLRCGLLRRHCGGAVQTAPLPACVMPAAFQAGRGAWPQRAWGCCSAEQSARCFTRMRACSVRFSDTRACSAAAAGVGHAQAQGAAARMGGAARVLRVHQGAATPRLPPMQLHYKPSALGSDILKHPPTGARQDKNWRVIREARLHKAAAAPRFKAAHIGSGRPGPFKHALPCWQRPCSIGRRPIWQ
jgi:hypothetical protein